MADAGGDPIRMLSDIPRVHAQGRGDHVAVECEGRTLTYAELERRANQAAGLLQACGARPGDRVAWLGKSSEAWYEIMFGAAKARACLAPINSRLAVPEIAFIRQDSGADLFFVTPEFFDWNVLMSLAKTSLSSARQWAKEIAPLALPPAGAAVLAAEAPVLPGPAQAASAAPRLPAPSSWRAVRRLRCWD